MSVFPSPEEVMKQFEQSVEPVVDVIRRGFLELFKNPPNAAGSYTIYPDNWWPSLGHKPRYDFMMAAFKIVERELFASGWVMEYKDDQRDGSYITVKPRRAE